MNVDPHFTADKGRSLSKTDFSRKGSVDESIRFLIEFINAQDSFYTTSSCSGRLIVFSEGAVQHKKGCKWLLVSHDEIDSSQLISSLSQPCDHPESSEGYIFFKFEPFILHTMCRSFTDAQLMLQAAVGSGFRNSGITCGKKGKIMVAVRSTHSLEVPVAHGGREIVSQEYLSHLVRLGNEKLKQNSQRIQRFHSDLQRALETQARRMSESSVPPSPSTRHKMVSRNPSCALPTHYQDKTEKETELDLGDLFS